MTEYSVNLPLVPLRVGQRIDRAAWPPHVTVVPNFVVADDRLDLLVDVVRRAARGSGPLRASPCGEALLGPARDLPVDLVHPEPFAPLHGRLAREVLRDLDAVPIEPAHWFDGHRPHVTRTPAGRLRTDGADLAELVLVEIGPGGDRSAALVLASFVLGGPAPDPVDEHRALALLAAFPREGVRPWVIGGWGVDALLGERSREHHDLDLFVDVGDLPRLDAALAAARLTVRSVWSENRWIEAGDRWVPSAFVAEGPDGEVDVHVIDLVDGVPLPLSTSTVRLPAGALDGRGRIGGVEVACATAAAQVVMHTGYALPPHQQEDLRRLRDRSC